MAYNDHDSPAALHASILAAALASRIEGAHRSAETRTRVAADLAILWIKSILIVNGGAFVGLTSLLTAESSPIEATVTSVSALAFFALSALITLVGLMIGYIGQANLIVSDEILADEFAMDAIKGKAPSEIERTTASSWTKAIIFAVLSLACLAAGLFLAIVSAVP